MKRKNRSSAIAGAVCLAIGLLAIGYVAGRVSRRAATTDEKEKSVDGLLDRVINSKGHHDELALQQAIDKEDYKLAAEIRDRIKKSGS